VIEYIRNKGGPALLGKVGLAHLRCSREVFGNFHDYQTGARRGKERKGILLEKKKKEKAGGNPIWPGKRREKKFGDRSY